jgi:hypothetical protein
MDWTEIDPRASTCTGRAFELWAIREERSSTWMAIYMDSYGANWLRDGFHTEQEARHAAETRMFAAIEPTLK